MLSLPYVYTHNLWVVFIIHSVLLSTCQASLITPPPTLYVLQNVTGMGDKVLKEIIQLK